MKRFLLLGLTLCSTASIDAAQMCDASQVRLLPGSPFYDRQELHRKGYVAEFDVARLLYPYRRIANLPQPEEVKSYGGWDNGFVRGHIAGHYLSAASRMFAATGDASFRDKANALVAGLAECQNAIGTGHLAAFPESVLDRAEGKEGETFGIVVPYYTIHKVLAGLLDAHHYIGNKQALEMAVKMSDRYAARMAALSPEQIEKLLRTDHVRNPKTEFGGMSDALTELATVTGDQRHLRLARIFNRDWFVEPLAAGEDRLANLHANTHLAQAVGIAHYAQATGDATSTKAARNFWKLVTTSHSFVIGGNSFGEDFDNPNVEAGPSMPHGQCFPYNTAETCNSHNLLKLTRYLFEQEPQAAYADWFERVLQNHILSSIAPDTGRVTYFHPLHGDFKIYLPGTECCVGSGIENTPRYNEGIYFRDADRLWINLYIPSELDWREKKLVLRQEGNIPYVNTVRFTVAKAAMPTRATLLFRIPTWVSGPVKVSVNGKPEDVNPKPSSYAEIAREWKAGDAVELTLPAALHLERARDRPETVSVLYGPLVLGAKLGNTGMPKDFVAKDTYKKLPSAPVPDIVSLSADPSHWLRLSDPASLTFAARDCGPASGLHFKPLNAIHHERYSVYLALRTAQAAATPGSEWAFPNARNPILSNPDGNLRDPAVWHTADRYQIFYSRFVGKWGAKSAWSVAMTSTRDFVNFDAETEITPKGYASPDGPVFWHDRWILAYCSYPANPSILHFSASKDGKVWGPPEPFLYDVTSLPWNTQHRGIDPTLVVDGDTMHCFFIGSGTGTDAKGKQRKGNMMGHAISRDPDLRKWEILTTEAPLIGLSDRAPDGVENLTIFKPGEQWLMILSEGLRKQHMALATSKDLMKWNLEGPLEIESQDWTGDHYGAPFVWQEGKHWMMVLMGAAANKTTTLGLLQSEDGRTWKTMPAR